MTDDEIKAIYCEVQRFRDHVEGIRRSLEPRQLSQSEYVSAIIDSMIADADEVFLEILGCKKQPATNIIERQYEWLRQEQESMRIQQQQAEYNNKKMFSQRKSSTMRA